MTAESTSRRPSISPDALAAILSAAPERLQKKLDREPRAADAWEWAESNSGWTIRANEETVTIPAQTITDVAQVQCSCLLSPRCFHVLAVLNTIPIENGPSIDPVEEVPQSLAETTSEVAGQQNQAVVKLDLSPAQLGAIHLMFEAVAGVLSTGLRAAGSVQQSRLLRAIHECRSEGLFRLSAGGLRVMNSLRSLRDHHEGFSSAEAASDLHEVLETCLRLQPQSEPVIQWIGIARRSFEPVLSLKLHALFCEPVLTRSGYSGVVTWLIGEDGWIGSVSDVQPGNAKRIPQAWQSGVTLAGLSISHRDLSQKCLLISRATRSVDGRLGGGESARAVVIDGQGWEASPIVARFSVPLEEQIRTAFLRQGESDYLAPAGTDLVFFSAMVIGYSEYDLIVKPTDSDIPLKLAIAIDDDCLSFRSSLQTLSRAPGLIMRCIGRIDFRVPGRILLLAVAPEAATNSTGISTPASENCAPSLVMSSERVLSIGLKGLTRSHLSKAEPQPVLLQASSSPVSSLDHYDDSLERWLRAIAVGGRHAIPHGLMTGVVQDAARLTSSLRPFSAALLRGLTQAATATQTEISGVRVSEPPHQLAQRWLIASIGSRAMTQHLQIQEWLRQVQSAKSEPLALSTKKTEGTGGHRD